MSAYQGNIIVKNPATPTGPFENGSAKGMWSLNEALAFKRQGIWPTAGIPGPDPYFPYVTLLLSSTSLSNANNNLFVDSSGVASPITRNGNPTQGSFTPYGSNWSNYFDGTGDWITTPNISAFDLSGSTTEFTIEAWVYNGNGGAYNGIIGARQNAVAQGWCLYIHPNNTLYMGSVIVGNSYADRQMNTTTIPPNTWVHVALVKTFAGYTAYVNGVGGTLLALTGGLQYQSTRPVIVGALGSEGEYPFRGHISNVRIVTGTAVYTSNFTPSTTPLTAISGTQLLTCQSNRFRDASVNNCVFTRSGDVRVTDFSPFSPTYPGAAYNQSDITNWSGYLNGSSYWTVPTSTALDVWDNGSGSFTVEAWIFATASIGNNVSIVAKAPNNGLAGWSPGWAFQVFNGYLNVNTPGDTRLFNSNTTSVPLNQWVHCALVKSGSTVSIYQNGVRVGTTTDSTAYSNTTDAVAIGVDRNFAGSKLTGYVSNVRMVKGTAVYDPTQSTLTVPTTNLTAVSGTSLLTLQSAAFTDNSGNNYLVNSSGTPTVTGNSPFNTVGYWSNYFDGTGDYLTAPYTTANFDWYTAGVDYTIEAWFFATTLTNTSYPNGGTQAPVMCGNRDPNSGTDYWSFGPTSEGIVAFYYFNGSAQRVASTTTISANRWNHVAMTKTSSGITLFVNGTAQTTVAISGTPQSSASTPFAIGQGGSSTYSFPGYISNLRIVRGTAIYSGNFTPPTSPLTAVTNTKLLTCQNGRFIDNSTNNFTITPNGDVSAQTFDPFYTATIASNGGSMYFDGTGDNLSMSNFPRALVFGTGNFTIELWVYPVSAPNNNWSPFFTMGNSGGGREIRISQNINGGGWGWLYPNNSNNSDVFAGFGTLPINTWSHIAMCREGSDIRLFLNGSLVSTGSGISFNFTNNTNLRVAMPQPAYADGTYNGYISNLRLTSSALYTGSFTPPTSPTSPTPATVLLLNGMNAGAFDAAATSDFETLGNAQVTTAVSKFGGSAIAFDGNGDYLLANTATNELYSFGTGDFTIETWVYVNSISTYGGLIDTRSGATTSNYAMGLWDNSGNKLDFIYGTTRLTSASTFSTGQWVHFAVTRASGTIRLFINGVVDANTATYTSAINAVRSQPLIGAVQDPYYLNGYIDDFRITKGYARYTANFTPPVGPFAPY